MSLKSFIKKLFGSNTERDESLLAVDSMKRPADSVERTAVITKQTGLFSTQSMAPEHRERFEKIFGPACIRNEYKHTIVLQSELLNLVLQAGESRVISEVLKVEFDQKFKHNKVLEWDPWKVLRDLVAEYERSQDPVNLYNAPTDSLCEQSKLKVWRLRGQQVKVGAPHRPISDNQIMGIGTGNMPADDPVVMPPALPPDVAADYGFPGFGGGEFSGAGAGGAWTPASDSAPSTEAPNPEAPSIPDPPQDCPVDPPSSNDSGSQNA